MSFKRTCVFIFLLAAATVCMAQGPAASGNTSASSQINVRIPAFVIITLADNSSKAIPAKSSADLIKSVPILSAAPADVISNRKWSVNVFREESAAGTYTASDLPSKSADTDAKTPSITVFYVTSLN